MHVCISVYIYFYIRVCVYIYIITFQGEDICENLANYSVILHYDGDKVTLHNVDHSFDDINKQAIVNFTLPLDIQEVTLDFVIEIMTCAGTNHSDLIEIGKCSKSLNISGEFAASSSIACSVHDCTLQCCCMIKRRSHLK